MFKMCNVYVYGFIFWGFLEISLTHILTPKDDWVPISKDEILSRLSRLNRRNADFSHFHGLNKEADINWNQEITKSTTLNKFNEPSSMNIFKKSTMNLVQPVEVIKIDQQSTFYPVAPDTITSVNDLQRHLDEKKNHAQPQNKIATESNESLKLEQSTEDEFIIHTNFRKPKTISVNHFTDQIDDDKVLSITKLQNGQEKTEKDSSQISAQENRKIYQVTEDVFDALKEKQSNVKERHGYFYKSPEHYNNHSMENNFTTILLDTLSKHNIRPEDDLPNYSLSRRQKNQNLFNGYMLIPIPLRGFPQFNHVNLDPLAVLLSNYGYYLPGAYGIRGKYRNLYGYLASNNIHNNKPFGSYKIFSDTDSSN